MFTVNFLEISIAFVLKLYSLNVIKKSRIESKACESKIKSGQLNRYPALMYVYLCMYVCMYACMYVYTVGTESIQTPLNFSLFVILQPFAKII